jgi:DNA-directed RNA polymerase specialized sigma24 family protein
MINEAWEAHHRDAEKRHAPTSAEGEPLDPFEHVLDPLDGLPIDDLLSAGVEEQLLSAEKQRARAQMVEHIESTFASNDDVTAILIGLEQGLPAREIQKAFDLSETQYDSARKRLRRFINKHYANQGRSYGQRKQEAEPPA